MAVITKEEQRRRQQRFARQTLGFVVVVLVVLGLISIFNMGLRVVERLTDQSDEMAEYGSLLRSMVLYDPAPFESVEDADPDMMRAVAVWGCIYDTLDRDGTLDGYEHDEETDRAILPYVDVDAFLTRLVGPEYTLDHETFTDPYGLEYQYDDERQGYLIPVTSMEQNYTPSVVSLEMESGRRIVTVGYVNNTTTTDLTSITSSEPQKYMEYVFERTTSRNWYLTAVRDSDMQISDTAAAAQNSANSVDLNFDPTQAVQESIDADDTIEIASSAAAEDEEDGGDESDQPEDGEDAPEEE